MPASISSLQRLFRLIYLKLVRINATPQKVALGAGIGVLSGILPGTGPIAAAALAFLFRANRAAALAGSLLTNTWLSFVIFIPAIKAGSFIFGVEWQAVQRRQLVNLSFSQVILPVITGYLAIGILLGAASYLITLVIVKIAGRGNK